MIPTSIFYLWILFLTSWAKDAPTQLNFNSRIHFESFHEKEGRLTDEAGSYLQIHQETINLPLAKKLIKNKLFQLKSLFESQKAPYPGTLTVEQSCIAVAHFSKTITENKKSVFWFAELPATSDFQYGACGSREEPFWSQYLALYCKKQKVFYDIKYFVKKEKENRAAVPVAQCL